MAKIDEYRARLVGDGPKQVTGAQFKKITSLDVPPHPMVPWMVKLFLWLREREGKPNWGKDDKDTMKMLETVIKDFKDVRHLLEHKDFNFYDYPTLLAEIADVRVAKLQKEINAIEGAKLMSEIGSKKLYLILTMEAAQKYGAGTRWCISATRSQSMWSSYTTMTSGGHKSMFLFVLDTAPRVKDEEKVAIQVGDIQVPSDDDLKRGGRNKITYNIKFWNMIDNPFSDYKMPNEFMDIIRDIIASKENFEDYLKLKGEKEKLAGKIKTQAIEAEQLQKKYADPAMYIMDDMNIPKTWENNLVSEVDARFKKFTSLRNIKHGSILSLGFAEQITSLGDLETVCDILDVRGCTNITEYKKLRLLAGKDFDGKDREAEVYYNGNTNLGLLHFLQDLIKRTGKGTMIYSKGSNDGGDPLAESK